MTKLHTKDEWQSALARNPVLHMTIKAGGDYQDACIELVKSIELLVNRLTYLEMVAPRRVHTGDAEYIYRCPNHLVSE